MMHHDLTAQTAAQVAIEHVGKMVAVVTGDSWQEPFESYVSSPLARRVHDLQAIATGHVTPSEEEAVRAVDALTWFFLCPFVGTQIFVGTSFEKSYWGSVINDAFAAVYTINKLVPTVDAGEYFSAELGEDHPKALTRLTLIRWRENGELHVVIVGKRPHYIRAEIERKRDLRRAELESGRKRPGRRQMVETIRPRVARKKQVVNG